MRKQRKQGNKSEIGEFVVIYDEHDNIIETGYIDEVAERMGIKEQTIRYYSWKRKDGHHGKRVAVIVEIEEV